MSRGQFVFAVVLMCGCFGESYGQFAGYISHAQSYHQNPLYNSAQVSDRLSETYGEFSYDREFDVSAIRLKYSGGLMMFDKFTERNSYEHKLAGIASFFFAPDRSGGLSAGDTVEEEILPTPDSAGSFLDVGLSLSARHDKEAYTEFDNTGVQSFASYRFHPWNGVVGRLTLPLEYRSYSHLDLLSNILTGLSVAIQPATNLPLSYALSASAGYKYYTSSLFDTTLFETRRSFVVKGNGKGKGGGVLTGPSSKQIIVNAQSHGIVQLTVAGTGSVTWKSGSAALDAAYSLNTGASSRYLAQNVKTSMLTDDLYNDHFAYEGPSAALRFTQWLIFHLQWNVRLEFQQKQFGAPALDLDGVQTSDHRHDVRGTAATSLTRKIALGRQTSLEVALSIESSRNQSNDMYNDYSYTLAAVTIGLNF